MHLSFPHPLLVVGMLKVPVDIYIERYSNKGTPKFVCHAGVQVPPKAHCIIRTVSQPCATFLRYLAHCGHKIVLRKPVKCLFSLDDWTAFVVCTDFVGPKDERTVEHFLGVYIRDSSKTAKLSLTELVIHANPEIV